MLFAATNGWNILDHKLSTGHIIAIAFFSIFIVSMVIITIMFAIYRNHIKKIYEIEKNIVILTNTPLEKKIIRIGNIVEQNRKYVNYATVLKSLYVVNIKKNGIMALSDSFSKSLKDDNLVMPNLKNIKLINSYTQELEKIKIQILNLSKSTDVLLEKEWELRDLFISVQVNWNKINNLYKDATIKLGKEKNIDYSYFVEYISAKNKSIKNFDNFIKMGNYSEALNVLIWFHKFERKVLEEIYRTPSTYIYINEQLEEELENLNLENKLNDERAQKLNYFIKKTATKVYKDLKEKKYYKAHEGVTSIKDEINNYTSDLKFENELRSFFNEQEENIRNILSNIKSLYERIKREDSIEFNNHKRKLKTELIMPINEVENLMINFPTADKKQLIQFKINFETQMKKVLSGLKLLKQIKPNEILKEEKYLIMLAKSYEAKTDIMASKKIMMDAQQWMSTDSYNRLELELENIEIKVINLNFKNLNEYKAQIQSEQIERTKLGLMNEYAEYAAHTRETVEFEYKIYQLAKAILVIVEMKNEESFRSIKDKMNLEFIEKKYSSIIKLFLANGSQIMNRRI